MPMSYGPFKQNNEGPVLSGLMGILAQILGNRSAEGRQSAQLDQQKQMAEQANALRQQQMEQQQEQQQAELRQREIEQSQMMGLRQKQQDITESNSMAEPFAGVPAIAAKVRQLGTSGQYDAPQTEMENATKSAVTSMFPMSSLAPSMRPEQSGRVHTPIEQANEFSRAAEFIPKAQPRPKGLTLEERLELQNNAQGFRGGENARQRAGRIEEAKLKGTIGQAGQYTGSQYKTAEQQQAARDRASQDILGDPNAISTPQDPDAIFRAGQEKAGLVAPQPRTPGGNPTTSAGTPVPRNTQGGMDASTLKAKLQQMPIDQQKAYLKTLSPQLRAVLGL
jgi:hypothetical protein